MIVVWFCMKTRYLSRYFLLYHPYHASCMSSLSLYVIVIVSSSIIFLPTKRAVLGQHLIRRSLLESMSPREIRITSTWPGLKIWEWVVLFPDCHPQDLIRMEHVRKVCERRYSPKNTIRKYSKYESNFLTAHRICHVVFYTWWYLVSGGPIPIKGHQLIGDEHVFLHLA